MSGTNENERDPTVSFVQPPQVLPTQQLQLSSSAKLDDDIEIICNSQELVSLNSELNKTKRQLADFLTQAADQQLTQQSLENAMSKLEADLKEALKQVSETAGKNATLADLQESQTAQLEKQTEQIVNLNNIVTKQEDEILAKDKRINETTAELDDARATNEKNKQIIAVLKNEVAQLSKSEAAQMDLMDQIKKNHQIRADLEKDLHELNKENDTIKKEQAKNVSIIDDLSSKLTATEQSKLVATEELAKAKKRIEQFDSEMKALEDVIEKARAESEKSKKLQQSFIRQGPSNGLTASQVQTKEKSMFSQFESLNAVLEEVESYKQQVLTYEDLFKNLDIELLLNAQIPQIEEKVQADSNPDKTPLRQKLLMEMALQMLKALQTELKQWKVELTYAIAL